MNNAMKFPYLICRTVPFLCGHLMVNAFVGRTTPEIVGRTNRGNHRIILLVTDDASDVAAPKPQVKPDILKPFLPAADPMWMCRGPVGNEDFVLSREGGATVAELANENVLKIVRMECSDLEVNTLVWKCLGYRFSSEMGEWTVSECFPSWGERYPTPPDFIGMQRM